MKNPAETNSIITRKRILIIIGVLTLVKAVSRYFLFPYESWKFHVALLITSFVTFLILWELVLITSRLLERVFPIEKRPVKRIVVQVFIIFIFNAFMGFSVIAFVSNVSGHNIAKLEKSLALLFYFWFALALNLIHFSGFFFKKWNENYILSERLRREKAEVRYDILRNKLNPHFLFNALTSLNSLIFENQQLASDFLQQLSKVYRYTLQHKDKDTVSLKTELNFIESYMKLFKIRFGDAIEFEMSIEESTYNAGIAPVTLQMLIENAIKHNVIDDSNPLVITISTKRNYLVVENNINRKIQVESSNGLGLANFRSFYQYLTDQPVVIENTGVVFIVKIPLI